MCCIERGNKGEEEEREGEREGGEESRGGTREAERMRREKLDHKCPIKNTSLLLNMSSIQG